MNVALTAPGAARTPEPSTTPPPAVSLPRLYLLRLTYLVVGAGLAITVWPSFITLDEPWPLMDGVVNCMLLAVSLLALLGVRYPLQMLPLLLFETIWKLSWLAAVALPIWTDGELDSATHDVVEACAWVILVLIATPWRYVFAQYMCMPGEHWRPHRQP